MAASKKYVTISLPIGIADDIDMLIEELGYWPSRGAFARDACVAKIREEQKRLKESKAEDVSIDGGR